MHINKNSKKQSVIILVIIAVILFYLLYIINIPKIPFKGEALVYSTQAETISSMKLRIPKIGVDAQVESMGLTPLGAMDVPKGPSNVGWYNLGPRPGEEGSSVIDGHFGWKNNIPAVFDNLHKLEKGDKIYVDDTKGDTVVFRVRELRIYKADDDASEVFTSNDGKSHLNLITCNGTWDNSIKNRPNRLVVFAERE